MISEQFEAQLMQAIVRQFFENPAVVGTMSDGTIFNVPARPTPASAVAANLLSQKNEELLKAIMDAIDIDVLAEAVAVNVQKTLLASENRYGFSNDPSVEIRKRLKEQIDSRLVELMAQDLYKKMQKEENNA